MKGLMKLFLTFFLTLFFLTIGNSFSEDFSTAIGRGCTPVLLAPGQSLDSLLSLAGIETDPVFATNGVKKAETNGWVVSSHSAFMTNRGFTINNYFATNGASIALTAGDVSAVSNTAAGIAEAGGLTNAVVKPITVYSITNPVITLSESINVWNWTPPTNVPLSCTFSGPGSGWAGSGMLRLVRTNGDNSVSWPTNVTFFSNGTRTTNAPTLDRYNRFVVDYFDGMWTLCLVSTNSVSL